LSTFVSADVADFLEQHGLQYEEIECDPDFADTQKFCEHYGYAFDESANVLLVASKKGEQKFAACVVLATCRLDVNKVVRKKLGVSRISFASPEQTKEQTGMELGGVTPFGMPGHIPVWIDARVMLCKRVVFGGGNRSSKIIMAPDELAKIPNSEVVPGLAVEIGA
jgi:prolyl-tRNA editing enzyme YbaK/EbsC (Cys-tRNA(Pro) deacylase)